MGLSSNEYKMTYYVGIMLAQGGVLSIRDGNLVFLPGTIERAVGATETVIPFEKIQMVDVTGTITESLVIKTPEKVHRFVGSEPYKIRDKIVSVMHTHREMAPPVQKTTEQAPIPSQTQAATVQETRNVAVSTTPQNIIQKSEDKCSSCSQPVRIEFNFCPSCGTILKKSCSKCYKVVETNWKFCPFCHSSI